MKPDRTSIIEQAGGALKTGGGVFCRGRVGRHIFIKTGEVEQANRVAMGWVSKPVFSRTGEDEQSNRAAMGRVGRHIFSRTGKDEQANRAAMASRATGA